MTEQTRLLPDSRKLSDVNWRTAIQKNVDILVKTARFFYCSTRERTDPTSARLVECKSWPNAKQEGEKASAGGCWGICPCLWLWCLICLRNGSFGGHSISATQRPGLKSLDTCWCCWLTFGWLEPLSVSLWVINVMSTVMDWWPVQGVSLPSNSWRRWSISHLLIRSKWWWTDGEYPNFHFVVKELTRITWCMYSCSN